MREKLAALTNEYDACQRAADTAESRIWTTSGAIGLGTIGSLAAIALAKADSSILIAAGVINISAIWIWWRISKRWWDVQHTAFTRMHHIEEKLNYYKIRYLKYRDGTIDLQHTTVPIEWLKQLRPHFLPEQAQLLDKKATALGLTEFVLANTPIDLVAAKLFQTSVYKLRFRKVVRLFKQHKIAFSEEQREQFKEHISSLHRGVQQSLRWLPWIITLTWIVLLIYQVWKALDP